MAPSKPPPPSRGIRSPSPYHLRILGPAAGQYRRVHDLIASQQTRELTPGFAACLLYVVTTSRWRCLRTAQCGSGCC